MLQATKNKYTVETLKPLNVLYDHEHWLTQQDLALVYLADFFHENGGVMIDCQFETPHLLSMGGRHIDYDTYMGYLRK